MCEESFGGITVESESVDYGLLIHCLFFFHSLNVSIQLDLKVHCTELLLYSLRKVNRKIGK